MGALSSIKLLISGDNEYKPNDLEWGIPQPAPTDRTYQDGVEGYAVHEINPNYLSYWYPETEGRGTWLLVGAMVWAIFFLGVFPLFFSKFFLESPDVPVWAVALVFSAPASVVVVFTFLAWRALRKPQIPPIYFDRVKQGIRAWGPKDGWEWLPWRDLKAAVRRYTLYNRGGRQTYYALVLYQLQPGSNRIYRRLPVSSMQRNPRTLEIAWDFMRRYMNESPERVPTAHILERGKRSPKRWAVRMQIDALGPWMNTDTGEIENEIDAVLMPPMTSLMYPFNAADLFVERVAPQRRLPNDLMQQLQWRGESNPYKIDAPGDNDPRILAMYEHVKLRHRLMMMLGFGFHGLALGVVIAGALVRI